MGEMNSIEIIDAECVLVSLSLICFQSNICLHEMADFDIHISYTLSITSRHALDIDILGYFKYLTVSDQATLEYPLHPTLYFIFTYSLGPVQEFVGISFTRDNLNCFRVN